MATVLGDGWDRFAGLEHWRCHAVPEVVQVRRREAGPSCSPLEAFCDVVGMKGRPALDVIVTHLERRYGLDPRIDRASRVVVSDRVALSVVDPRAGLVHGDNGRGYWATVDGFCECPDAERVAR
jgi:hypothetical protein